MSEHTKTVKTECTACGGTGLYVGMGEGDGFAVQCSRCKGTGEETRTFRWRDFEGRKVREGVVRVLEVNPGIIVGTDSGHSVDAFGGVDYATWLNGEGFPPGSEMRDFTCPVWWYQSADYNRKPKWSKCGLGQFSACKHFANKAACWTRFDEEEER